MLRPGNGRGGQRSPTHPNHYLPGVGVVSPRRHHKRLSLRQQVHRHQMLALAQSLEAELARGRLLRGRRWDGGELRDVCVRLADVPQNFRRRRFVVVNPPLHIGVVDESLMQVWCGVVWCGVVWCGVVWCGVVWCGVVWCGVVWCGVVWCGVVWRVMWCGVVWCGVVWCGVVWCGVVWCGVVWCGVVWCGVVWCGVVWCGVVWCGVVWCGVVWCGVVWCGVVWCGVVWCGVPKALLPNGKRPGCLPKGKGKRAGLCVLRARCV